MLTRCICITKAVRSVSKTRSTPASQPSEGQVHEQTTVKWSIDQFRYNKVKPKRIDLSARLRGITTEFEGFIPQSLVLMSIVFG